jgi:hypothetical protein
MWTESPLESGVPEGKPIPHPEITDKLVWGFEQRKGDESPLHEWII